MTRIAAAWLLLAALAGRGAAARSVRGHLLEVGTDQPVSAGTVALLTDDGEPVGDVGVRLLGPTRSLVHGGGGVLLYATGWMR